MDFFKYLNYSLGNEDWCVEEQALRPALNDHVVCVTASGDRPLHLLMTDCASINAIDLNPIQTHLLALKLAAITELDFDDYLAFLGLTPTAHRLDIFRKLAPALPHDSLLFWESHQKMIARGVIYQGRIERLTYFSAQFIKLFRHKKIKTLLSFDDLESQRAFLVKHWDTKPWRLFFETIINPSLCKFVLNDPGFSSHIEYVKKPGKYIYDRMFACLNQHLAKNCALVQLILTGRVLPQAYFPYLTFDGYQKIRKNPNRLKFHTANIIDYLQTLPKNSVNCFSLSDIASYMPQKSFEGLLHGVLHAARPEARFSFREFMSKREIPDNLIPYFKRNTALEEKLEKEESNFVYRFMVGEVQE